MGDINYAMHRMVYWCRDANLGYGQDTRTHIWPGGAADCSSLVLHVLKEAGFDTGSAYYTGDMLAPLLARGWRSIPISQRTPGCVLLTPNDHVALLLQDGNLVGEAYINEKGRITGGADGDQTGSETRIAHYSYRSWAYCLQPPANSVNSGSSAPRVKTEEEKIEEELMGAVDGWLKPMWDKLVFIEGVLTDTKINWVQPIYQRVLNCETRLSRVEKALDNAEKNWLKYIWDKAVQVNGTVQSINTAVKDPNSPAAKSLQAFITGLVSTGYTVNGVNYPGLHTSVAEILKELESVKSELTAIKEKN